MFVELRIEAQLGHSERRQRSTLLECLFHQQRQPGRILGRQRDLDACQPAIRDVSRAARRLGKLRASPYQVFSRDPFAEPRPRDREFPEVQRIPGLARELRLELRAGFS